MLAMTASIRSRAGRREGSAWRGSDWEAMIKARAQGKARTLAPGGRRCQYGYGQSKLRETAGWDSGFGRLRELTAAALVKPSTGLYYEDSVKRAFRVPR